MREQRGWGQGLAEHLNPGAVTEERLLWVTEMLGTPFPEAGNEPETTQEVPGITWGREAVASRVVL